MKVLVGCEYSGIVRDSFKSKGHDAYSCDIIDTEKNPEYHFKMDIFDGINQRPFWDLIILHVPCTYMAVSANRHYSAGKEQHFKRIESIDWTLKVWDFACSKSKATVLENPGSVIFPVLREKRHVNVSYIQPWQFGHPETKKTGLALRNVPPLQETKNVYEEMMELPIKDRHRIFWMSGKDRAKERARTYNGIALAMADQWGNIQ